ncbi:hypothetical protein C1752_01890 [Acaryochloris thomasi RCC1774]|uniref:General secretion pathway protein GspH n=1 Tax=Acaryochloris thomasi RCC1774 TaxID=1764569 RepID=A0A2W1JJD7_9CYAN|nr:type IV pilin-like G/H family protein [Acaryochloris thomasi]PZD73593.1 hypothetical protein C1752_01890 [Acaryochloris thomasi RCC1774]
MSNSRPNTRQNKGGVSSMVKILGGCGCLAVGGFVLMILLAIALPSFLRELALARKSEGAGSLSAINRSQQAYRLENKGFATSIDDLDGRIVNRYFDSRIVPQLSTMTTAIATTVPLKGTDLKSYTAFVFVLESAATDLKFVSGICETDVPSRLPPAAPPAPSSETEPVQCPLGSSLVE